MRILLTGAAGIVGTAIRPYLSDFFEKITLTDIDPVRDLKANEKYIQGDILDRQFVDTIVQNVDGLVHMAGLVGPDYTFDQVLGPNIQGTFNLFNSAHAHGLKNIIYASSHHVVGFMRRGSRINTEIPMRPDSYYGVSKGFGEILATFFCDKYGLKILSIRIGSVTDRPVDERRLHLWCSPKDLARLIKLGFMRQENGYRVVYGISECPDPFFDNHSAEEIGYKPMDRSLDHLDNPDLFNSSRDQKQTEPQWVGGYFATNGIDK